MDKIWANSGDSHLIEPADLFETSLPADLAGRMPRSVKDPDGQWETVYIDGSEFRRRMPRSTLVDPETGEGMLDKAPGSNDAHLRLKDLDDEGIWAELIYPSLGIWAHSIRDPQLLAAGCAAVNDWAIEYQRVSPRYVCTATIPILEVDGAVAEVERGADLGFKAAFLPVTPPGEQDWNDDMWEPVWTALDETGTVLGYHIGTEPHDASRPATVSITEAPGAPCSTTWRPPTAASARRRRWSPPASSTAIPTSRSSCRRAAPPGARSSPTGSTRLTASTPRRSGRACRSCPASTSTPTSTPRSSTTAPQ